MSRDQRIDQSATSIQSLLNTNGATFLMTSHVRSALWTLLSNLYIYCAIVDAQRLRARVRPMHRSAHGRKAGDCVLKKKKADSGLYATRNDMGIGQLTLLAQF